VPLRDGARRLPSEPSMAIATSARGASTFVMVVALWRSVQVCMFVCVRALARVRIGARVEVGGGDEEIGGGGADKSARTRGGALRSRQRSFAAAPQAHCQAPRATHSSHVVTYRMCVGPTARHTLIFTSLRLPVESEVAVLMGGDVAAGSRVAVVSCRRRYAFLPYGGKKAIVVVQWRVCAHTDRW
jgi:hypothetical protein